jgi:hypothetical protein
MTPCWACTTALLIVAATLPACAAHRALQFETASKPPDEPRRPDGVAVDLESALPSAQPTGSTRDGLVPLQEPVDDSHAMQSVRVFFRAVSNEDVETMSSVLANDAQQLPMGTGSGMRVDRHWERRFRKFDYAVGGGELPYRDSMVETYRFEDLAEPLPGRPLRPVSMTPQDVLIRVPVTRTRYGIDRVFGEELLFLLRRQGRQFEIHTVHEDFVAP